MNIRDLKYLVAVAEHRHFGKAAEACFVSQPTLSTQLKKLEEELNVVIFERNNKQVMLTNAGKVLVEQAQRILLEVSELVQLAKLSADPMSGPYKIGIIPTLSPYLLPHVIGPLREAFCQCEFFLIEEKTEDCLKDLYEGKIDAAILALPVDDAHFEIAPLFEENFMLAMPKDHRLAKKKSVKSSDLNEETILLLEEGHCLRDQALEFCSDSSIQEKVGFRATSLETLRHMVAVGSGITLLPELAVKTNAVDNGMLTVLPFQKPVPKREVAMIWRKFTARRSCSKAIADLISKTIKGIL